VNIELWQKNLIIEEAMNKRNLSKEVNQISAIAKGLEECLRRF